MAVAPLSPVTRRVVGWMLVASGILLGLGQLIRLGVAAYLWSAGSADGLGLGLAALYFVGLVGASLLVRYGRRLLRGGQLQDGPAEEIIL